MDANEIIWRPDPETASRTRIARFMRAHGLATLEDLQRRSVEDLEWYWSAVVRDLGWAWTHAVPEGGRHLARHPVAALVRGRAHEPDGPVRGRARGRGARRQARGDLGGRGRRRAHADLRGAGARGRPLGQCAHAPRGRGWRHRRHLPADVPGGGRRGARGDAHRRGLRAVLLGLWRPGGGRASHRVRRQGADHRRRLRPPRQRDPDEAHRRRGGGRISLGPARDRAPADRRRHSVDAGPRRLVARGGGRPSRRSAKPWPSRPIIPL